MDYIKKYISGDYIQKRQQQIDREMLIDKGLECLPCTREVNSFFLYLRRNNRVRVREYSECPFSTCSQILENHLSQVDKELDQLEDILSAKDPCKILALLGEK